MDVQKQTDGQNEDMDAHLKVHCKIVLVKRSSNF